MSGAARIAFALLVCATFAAFFVAQELKSTPPLVQHVTADRYFSPNHDGRLDHEHASFDLKRADDVTATVVDHAGDSVRVLFSDRSFPAKRKIRLVWDGTRADHEMVPDGTYRIRLNLRRQGRAVLLPRNIVKDTKPPNVLVTSIGPQRDKVPRPEFLPRPDGKPAVVHFVAPDPTKLCATPPGSTSKGCRHVDVLVYRTDVTPARMVFPKPIELANTARSWSWNGTLDGRRVAAGTYVVVVRARDRAGNIGSSTPIPPPLRFGQKFRGRGGITVRYLTAQAASTPVVAGKRAVVAVESVNKRFSWTLRRVGEREVRKRGRGTQSRLVHFTAPGGKSGLYVFEVRTRTRKAAAPVVVQSAQARPVLVVLPLTTWQGLNPVDDDGDGRPDTLAAGLPVRIGRPFVKSGLPAQLPEQEALLLAQLDRGHHRYDLTTDVALARGQGPQLAGHRGVILAGDTRWLDVRVAKALRSFVRGGGNLLSVGTQSLRRTVQLTPGGRAIDPTPATPRDLFGARLQPIVRLPAPTSLVNVVDDAQLFVGTTGQFTGIRAFEQTLDVRGPSESVAAAAATQDGRREVIVASRLGKGLVIRPGLPDFSASLKTDGELRGLLERIWTLLSRP
ncbi:MAG TPA: N,N-dimethylformamidase beta subunit family domain-containing protein [Solirubrobacteraceae bacterium]